MIALSEIEVKLDTIEMMDGDRVATQQEVDRRYRAWEADMGNDLQWVMYFAAYNSRQVYLDEVMP